MRSTLRTFAIFVVVLASAAAAGAQPTLDLAGREADPIWRGTQAGARAGAVLDHGAVSWTDSRRDLIIGSPGGPGIIGTVYVLFGGLAWTGDLSLAGATTTIQGATAGDLFGSAVASGNVISREGTNPKTLMIAAPAASSNRGIVYVFAAGFEGNDDYVAADAVARIIGRPGDRLGTSLATADLNNDGYREIVMSAPGNSAIHVVAGGPTLSGTIDLSVTAPTWTFTYPGLSANLWAGDITGDGIYDVLVGHPAANAVHVLRGRNGTMPPATMDMSFGGIDTGDGVGVAVRLADVDADRITDVIIGAPNAGGPSNSRSNAGEAYLIWGGPSLTARSLAAADVTFYGAFANERLGALLAGGDINRDTPNDLVFLSSGARGGAGRLDVYYGRERHLIGVPRADGKRVVDFASAPPDRAILGDTGGGSITAAQVYEVTGEGARDVIVGMSGNNGDTGAVYFTISPRMTLSASTLTINGYEGVPTSGSIRVENPSMIAINWDTRDDQSWLSATPRGSTSGAGSGEVVVTANGQGLAPGTYQGTVTVNSTSSDLHMTQTLAVTFVVRATQPAPATPPVAGQPPGAAWKLFWRHASEGWLAVWRLNGVTLTGQASISMNRMTNPSWKIAGVGDVNGDGHRDLVWQADDGSLAAWLLQDTQVVATSYLSISRMTDVNWKIRGVGDTNGDGKADLVWQNLADGRLAVWLMNGTQVLATQVLSIPRQSTPNWHIRAVGDTNGDGKADVLWHKADTGELAVWYLNGSQVTGTFRLSIASMTDTNWQMVGAEDVNGDRKADILWQHADGRVATWYLSGRDVIQTLLLNPSRANSLEWKVAGPK